MIKHRVILRGDGTAKTGFGHIYRLLALAQTLHEDFECIFVSHILYPFLKDELSRLGIGFVGVPEIDYSASDDRKPGEEVPFDMENILTGSDIVVTDGYWFGPDYQRAIKARGCRLVCIDDLAEHEYVSDVIINHSPGAVHLAYHCSPDTRLCLGLAYLLIRPVFINRSVAKRAPGVRRVFLSIGGSDHLGITPRVLAAALPFLGQGDRIMVLITNSFSAETKEAIEGIIRQGAGERVQVVKNLNAIDLCDLLDACTHAIVPSSTISLETVARGLKPLVGYYTLNQVNTFEGLLENGLGVRFGDFRDPIDPSVLSAYLSHDGFSDAVLVKQKTKEVFYELAATKG